MRLIDADNLEKDTEWDYYDDGFMSYSQFQIDNAPTIDAKLVVQCKDCVNRYTDTCPAYQSIYGDMHDEDFCSFGIQKEVKE